MPPLRHRNAQPLADALRTSHKRKRLVDLAAGKEQQLRESSGEGIKYKKEYGGNTQVFYRLILRRLLIELITRSISPVSITDIDRLSTSLSPQNLRQAASIEVISSKRSRGLARDGIDEREEFKLYRISKCEIESLGLKELRKTKRKEKTPRNLHSKMPKTRQTMERELQKLLDTRGFSPPAHPRRPLDRITVASTRKSLSIGTEKSLWKNNGPSHDRNLFVDFDPELDEKRDHALPSVETKELRRRVAHHVARQKIKELYSSQ